MKIVPEKEIRIGLILGDHLVGYLDELPIWAQAYIKSLWDNLDYPKILDEELSEGGHEQLHNRPDIT